MSTTITKTHFSKNVMVIGGGPAGMNAALAASERGHKVTLYEKTEKLGGQLHLAGAPPGREEFLELAKDLSTQLDVHGIQVVLNQAVDTALLEREKPDHVILSTGAKPLVLPIPGSDQSHVVQAWDVLLNKVSVGRRVVIVGGGAVGVETALFLAEKGTLSGDAVKFLLLNGVETPEDLKEIATQGTKEVILVEMLEKVGKDIGKSTRWVMMGDLNRYGVDTRTATKVLGITKDGIQVESNGTAGNATAENIPADTIVMATGSVPENRLQKELTSLEIPFTLAGDAKKIRLAFDAVHEGFDAGRNL